MKVLIKDVALVQLGYQSRRRIDPNPAGAFKIIQIKDATESGELVTDDLYAFSPEGDPRRYLVDRGDILFASRGRCNLAYLIAEPLSHTVASGMFYIVRAGGGHVLPEYLAWYVNQPPAQAWLKSTCQATNIPFISKAAFESLEVDIPPVETQAKIVKLVDLFQREKALNQQVMDKREQLVREICLRASDH